MQQPLNTPWTAFTTADEIAAGVNLEGKNVIITGGASGLGLETARVLAQAGANVTVTARSPTAGAHPIPKVEVAQLELEDHASIERFAKEFVASGKPLHILILNAGIMASPLTRDFDGNEGQFSTNHLGHFSLAVQLWSALKAARGARIVALSSRGHQIGGFDLSDLRFERREYNKWLAYGQSKTANSLFAVGADVRGVGDGIRAFAVHPGSIVGPLARHLSKQEIAGFGALNEDGSPVIDPENDKKNFAQGAATTVWCAISPDLEGLGGVYCENSDIASVETQARKGVRPYATDPRTADLLWEESVRLTGLNI
ncbi:NAD(P)-dependent dehydrogenase (short-subunit alcohol dehydrogenase family) [Rhizobium leguminosarum]|uniref:NAD(P)-dependent dehydrogenase (Short-subunit alcohol dehydrogenase family) n=1 Tax=Rhizobium leguminosarum TaxID=384 RepID=A0AAE2ML79_RHILE|nr:MULTISPECIES: SDR family NAD(P)-dependent oxidoreductase [Rhizobium]MBB4291488.1 NAD(P)-dependent dehydrogenase (short-subunit alcohol dehydrogenase family) [Rhizobium leguminosarum]MBB4296185.1 NAD(P)-dependent dehydrogenase (short-subunit alcohol dehydrogenase family) [Rhizobium leguminosarum]MBB4308556.1 NAD(P)-dependent dehydrogenase (short-subunit alcohol dehydrogenase family) [Rhizobium leguminosarum]MBB4416391.1 NAD(P)-dependent dehydrogenase (short-subunit alcohol dehydrogenase famil